MAGREGYDVTQAIVRATAATSDYIVGVKDGQLVRWLVSTVATAISSALESVTSRVKVRSVSVSTTFLSTDNVLLVDSSGGDITISMLEASVYWNSSDSVSRVMTIKQTSASNTVTVDGYLSQTIDGSASYALTGKGIVTLVSDGSNLHIVGQDT
jgi:hypothetical protein